MRQFRGYARALQESDGRYVVATYENEKRSNGFIPAQKRRELLGLKEKEKSMTESDFWYRIRLFANAGMLDFDLLCWIADDDQLKEIFRQNDGIDSMNIDVANDPQKKDGVPADWKVKVDGKVIRTDFDSMFYSLLYRNPNPVDNWRDLLAIRVAKMCFEYLRKQPSMKGNLDQQAIAKAFESLDVVYNIQQKDLVR